MCLGFDVSGVVNGTTWIDKSYTHVYAHHTMTGLARHAVISRFSRFPQGQRINVTQVNLP